MQSDKDNTYSVMVHKGRVEEASYMPPELPKFSGNPLIEALPPINTRSQVMKALRRFPDYDEEMRQLPSHLRTQSAMDVLHFFRPLPIHLKLEGMISRTIRDGYLPRNPMDPAYAGNLQERLLYFKQNRGILPQFAPSAAGFTVAGMSGLGKSTSLRNILDLYPQVVLHNSYRERNFTKVQLGWLILECPKDGSTRALCIDFFTVVDAILGTDYSEKYGRRARNTEELTRFMANVAARHHLGLLVIDEIQNLNQAKSGGAKEMLNFFVGLINKIGLPVVLVGTGDVMPILMGSFRQARRGSGQGDVLLRPMPLDDPYDRDWHELIPTLWSLQYTRKVCPLTTKLSCALHNISYGVTDLAIRIYLVTQVRAIEGEIEEITEGFLRSAYRDDFQMMSYIVKVLKSGNINPNFKIEDASLPPQLPVFEVPHANEENNDESADSDASTTTNSNQHETSEQVMTSSKKANSHRRTHSSRKKIDAFEPGDLRGIVSQGLLSSPPVSSYQSLKNAGYIKSSDEYLREGSR